MVTEGINTQKAKKATCLPNKDRPRIIDSKNFLLVNLPFRSEGSSFLYLGAENLRRN